MCDASAISFPFILTWQPHPTFLVCQLQNHGHTGTPHGGDIRQVQAGVAGRHVAQQAGVLLHAPVAGQGHSAGSMRRRVDRLRRDGRGAPRDGGARQRRGRAGGRPVGGAVPPRRTQRHAGNGHQVDPGRGDHAERKVRLLARSIFRAFRPSPSIPRPHDCDGIAPSKIECRTEEDDDVKKYLHHREEEVIVVKQPDVVNSIDGSFGELMAPILARLREERVSHWLYHDSANMSAYTVMQAQQQYFQDPNADPRLHGPFKILQELAHVRQRLTKYGVKEAHQKLVQSTHKPFMGYMKNQPKFQSLLNDLELASGTGREGAEGSRAESSPDKNNPKLTKLAEVLVEHFERKNAIDESTRVIVFSQWRESVCGIVQMLHAQNASLIKPAQFIGQASKKSNKGRGKIGSLNSNDSGQDAVGMNQKQQQKVLQQFSEGTYNVLVCTCVGEEGLDVSCSVRSSNYTAIIH